MDKTIRDLNKNVNINYKVIAVIVSIILFIYIGIATSSVTGVRDVLQTGFQDGVTLNEETRTYEIAGNELKTFPRYRYGVAFGESNQFNYALDGFSYTDTLGIGNKTFVFDYSWYGGTEFESREVVNYINNNYWLMVFRMVVYSNQLVIALMLFVGLLIINYWLLPIITHALSSMFGLIMAIRGTIEKDDNNVTVRVYEARILRQTAESYEKSQFIYWVSGLIALAVSLYSVRLHEDSSVFVALWVNVTVVIFYLLNKIAVNHIKIVKEYKGKGVKEDD